jgi:hypothetical protein
VSAIVVTFLFPSPGTFGPEPEKRDTAPMSPLYPCPLKSMIASVTPPWLSIELPEIVYPARGSAVE